MEKIRKTASFQFKAVCIKGPSPLFGFLPICSGITSRAFSDSPKVRKNPQIINIRRKSRPKNFYKSNSVIIAPKEQVSKL
jgi:hypothetical protein